MTQHLSCAPAAPCEDDLWNLRLVWQSLRKQQEGKSWELPFHEVNGASSASAASGPFQMPSSAWPSRRRSWISGYFKLGVNSGREGVDSRLHSLTWARQVGEALVPARFCPVPSKTRTHLGDLMGTGSYRWLEGSLPLFTEGR